MREITATDAARRFSDVLDAVEHDGESFSVSRRGRVVARIEPEARANGAKVIEVLRNNPVDPDWAGEIRELRALLVIEDRNWPD